MTQPQKTSKQKAGYPNTNSRLFYFTQKHYASYKKILLSQTKHS